MKNIQNITFDSGLHSYKTSNNPLFISSVLLVIAFCPIVIISAFSLTDNGILVGLFLTVVSAVAVYLGKVSSLGAVLVLTLVLPLQPFLTMLVSDSLGPIGIKGMVATKEFYVTALLAGLIYKNKSFVTMVSTDIIAAIYLVVNVFYFFMSSAPYFARLVSFREAYMIAAFYFIGRLLLLNWDEINIALKYIICTSIVIALFGFMERFLFSGPFWESLGAGSYMVGKFGFENEGAKLADGLPLQWYTYIGEEPKRRMVSTIGDATSLSRYLSLPLLILFYFDSIININKKINLPLKIFIMILLSAAIILTLGRGGLLITIGGLTVLFFFKKPVISLLLGLPVVLFILSGATLFDLTSGSAVRHFSGFMSGIYSLGDSLFGHGLGSSGQMAVFYSDQVEDVIIESYFAAIAYQSGLPGLIVYFAFIISIVLVLLNIYKNNKSAVSFLNDRQRLALLCISVVGGIMVTSMLGNSAVAPISSGLSFVLSGMVITAYKKELNGTKVIK